MTSMHEHCKSSTVTRKETYADEHYRKPHFAMLISLHFALPSPVQTPTIKKSMLARLGDARPTTIFTLEV